MDANIKHILLWQAAAIVAVAALMAVFPGENYMPQLLRMTGAGVVAALCYRLTGNTDKAGYYTLTAFWTLLAAGLTLNIWYFTTYSGGTPDAPVLLNDDASISWAQMTAFLEDTNSGIVSHRRGYGTFLALISCGQRLSIGSLLCINMLAVLLAIVLTGAAAARMARTDDAKLRARTATLAMIFTGGVCYFLASGAILIKDAICQLIMAVVLFTFYGRSLKMTVGLLIAALVAILVRPNMLPFMALAALLSMPLLSRKGMAAAIIFALALCASFFWQAHQEAVVLPLDPADGNTMFYLGKDANERLNAYSQVSGYYEATGVLHKIMLLPFSLCVQFLTPLPWAFGRDIVFGPSLAWSHFSLPWYALGGLLLFFFTKLRKAPRAVTLAFAFGVCAWCASAFMTGGTVSRYCLPWLPFLTPAAAWLVTSGQLRTKAFRRWAIVYGVVLAAGLCAVFICLNIYSPGGWEAR